MPGAALPFSFQNVAMTMPIKIEKMAPPTTGTNLPSRYDGIAMAKQTRMPGNFLYNDSIFPPNL